jgi:hypothetical protein
MSPIPRFTTGEARTADIQPASLIEIPSLGHSLETTSKRANALFDSRKQFRDSNTEGLLQS